MQATLKACCIYLLLICLFKLESAAQTSLYTSNISGAVPHVYKNKNTSYPRNVLKMNLSSLALKNYNFSYERLIARKISVIAGYRYMPKTTLSNLKLSDKLIEMADDEDIREDLDRIDAANNTITAEIRFYTGKKPGAKGFYFGLYGRSALFKVDYLYDYDVATTNYQIPLQSKSNGLGGGLLMGAQFAIAKRLMFDIYVLGAHYGTLNGDLSGNANLSALTEPQRQDLKRELDELIVIKDKNLLETQVTGSGVTGTVKGPFAGVRGLGLNVGFAF